MSDPITLVGLAGAAPVVGVLAALTALAYAVRRDWQSLAAVVVSLGTTAGLTWILKTVIARARPVGALVDPWDLPGSFPSGHAALSLTFYGLLAYLATRKMTSPGRRVLVAAAALSLVIAIGASRVVDAAHDSLDVVGGYGVAAVGLGVGLAVGRRRFSAASRRHVSARG
jgi:undecaprenyl-diphosphatase